MLPTDHINTSPSFTRDATHNRLLLNTTDYTYDNAGQFISAPDISGYHSMWHTAEGYLRSIDNYNTGSYLYNSLGERTLAIHGSLSAWNEYIYLNNQPMADIDNTGVWTDNIYANGQKIARVASAKPVLQFKGTRDASSLACGVSTWASGVDAISSQLGPLQPGDTLSFDQRMPATDTGTYAQGGIGIWANGAGYGANDAEGQPNWNSTVTDGAWHHRNFEIGTPLAGQTLSNLEVDMQNGTPTGDFELDYANIVFTRADGTVLPLFTGSQGISLTLWGGGNTLSSTPNGTCGGTNLTAVISPVTVDATEGASYFLTDQVGITQMELSSGGTPLWKGAFTPFGQEIINGYAPTYVGTQPADGTTNRYKFTGKERDKESGFDYFGARYYASGMGRFTSADPKPASAHLENPQTLNRYVYGNNSPLSMLDPNGEEPVTITFRAFIPQASMGGYRGDNRSFSSDPRASSRTSISFTIETDRFKRGGTNPMLAPPITDIGQTHFFHFLHRTAKDHPVASAQYDSHGLTDVNIHEDVVNPLGLPGTPPIHADVNLSFTSDGTLVDATANLSESPAFEINIGENGQTTNFPIQGASQNFPGFVSGLFRHHNLQGDGDSSPSGCSKDPSCKVNPHFRTF